LRWIQHDKNKINRGDTEVPEGNAFFVDEKGSAALVDGKLYIDGKPAYPGRHDIQLKDGILPIDVDVKGRALRRPMIRGVPNG
jgi:hypothetical protein